MREENSYAVADTVDMAEIWRVVWSNRWKIFLIAIMTGMISSVISLKMPNIYRAEVLLAPVNDSGNTKASGALSQLSGMASIAGISLGNSSASLDENLATLNSRTFLWIFIQENDLMPILFEDDWDSVGKRWKESDPKKQPSIWDAYRLLTKGGVFHIDRDKKTDMVSVAFEWKDAELAAKWGNGIVARLNEYLRQQAISRSQANLEYLTEALGRTQAQEVRLALYDLITQEQKKVMLASTQKEFAFQVIDKATPPDRKFKPKRMLIVLGVSLLMTVLTVVFVIIRSRFSSPK